MVRLLPSLALLLVATVARADEPPEERGRLGFTVGVVSPPWTAGDDNFRGGTAGGSLSFELTRVTRYRDGVGWLWGGRTRFLHESENTVGAIELTVGLVGPIEPGSWPRLELDASVGVMGGERRRDGVADAHFGVLVSARASIGWTVSDTGTIAVVIESVGWLTSVARAGFPIVGSLTYQGAWE